MSSIMPNPRKASKSISSLIFVGRFPIIIAGGKGGFRGAFKGGPFKGDKFAGYIVFGQGKVRNKLKETKRKEKKMKMKQ
jgi:hypothetical protein